MKIFISKQIPKAATDLLKHHGHIVSMYDKENEISVQDLIDQCQKNEALLFSGKNKLDADFFKSCSHLKAIALMSVGYDNVAVDIAATYTIPVSNTPGVLSKATSDIAFLLMLAVSRNAFMMHRFIADDQWSLANRAENFGIELYGKTLGIFGMGRIGYELAKKAKGVYDMNIIYHSRSQKPELEKELHAMYVDFDKLVCESDVISVHSNLSEETEGIFDSEVFPKMKNSAIFINTARGGIHNEKDLITALKQQQIWGAGLDVTDPEPMQPDNPLLKMRNVAVLPHIGSATAETREAMAIMAAENLIAIAEGKKMPQQIIPD